MGLLLAKSNTQRVATCAVLKRVCVAATPYQGTATKTFEAAKVSAASAATAFLVLQLTPGAW